MVDKDCNNNSLWAETKARITVSRCFLAQPGGRSSLNPITWIDCDPTGCAGQVEQACENQRRVPRLKVIKDQGNNDWAKCAPDLTGCVHAPSHHTGVFASDIHTNAPAGTQEEGGTGSPDANQQS